MRVTVLGSGTPAPSLRRASSGYMVEVGDQLILLDHGPGAHQRLLETGKRAIDVDCLALTHLHYDHCLDYVRLLLTRWDQNDGSRPELQVFGPEDTARMTDRLIGPDGAFARDLEARTRHEPSVQTYVLRGGTPPRPWPAPEVSELASGAEVSGSNWSLRCISVPHAQPHLGCLGYRLDCDSGSLAYSGDAGPSTAFSRFAEGADILIHMCHQISGTAPGPAWERGAAGHLEVARAAADAGVKILGPSHIPSQMDVPGMRERLTREMAPIFEGEIIWAEDLLEIPIEPAKAAAHVG
jgi:ribonuclease BN (tRNA processing enzyme)